MPSVNPVELLLCLADAARDGRPVPPAAAGWLVGGIAGYLEGQPLAVALGLGSPGQGHPSARHRFLIATRDHHLWQAHRLTDGTSHWARSVALAREVRRFAAAVWPRWRELPTAPAEASRLRFHLDAAHRTGLEVPTSPRQLARIAARVPDAPAVVRASVTV